MENIAPIVDNHVCGACHTVFEKLSYYLEHECKDGKTPTDPAHLGPAFEKISEAAMARGEARKNAQQ